MDVMDSTDRMRSFVAEVWRTYLGRQPGPDDLADLAAALAGGVDPVDYLFSVAGCAEAVERRAATQGVPLCSPPGHFHSPIVDPQRLAKSGFRGRRAGDRSFSFLRVRALRWRGTTLTLR